MQNFAFTQPSILQRLYDALDERGRLPRDYSLQQALEPEGPAGGFYYSDGFMEGNITGLDKGGEESPELQDGLWKESMTGRSRPCRRFSATGKTI